MLKINNIKKRRHISMAALLLEVVGNSLTPKIPDD
jgi:hypothetical protein